MTVNAPEACTAPECDCPLADVPETAREALYDANWKDADEFCRGALGSFVLDVSQYTEIVAELMKHATERALSITPPPQCALRAAAERVCWFEWSDNDMDARAAIDALRKAVAHARPERCGGTE